MFVLTVGLLGIASSLATELVTWLNKKFDGTVLKGDGAFVLSATIALVIGFFQAIIVPIIPGHVWDSITVAVGSVFGISQVWFKIVGDKLGLQIKESDPIIG